MANKHMGEKMAKVIGHVIQERNNHSYRPAGTMETAGAAHGHLLLVLLCALLTGMQTSGHSGSQSGNSL